MIRVEGDRLCVSGPMLIGSAAQLKAAGLGLLTDGVGRIDLSGVTEADSSAVALLLAWVRAAEDRGQPVTIIDPPESIRSLAALYGVAELLPLA